MSRRIEYSVYFSINFKHIIDYIKEDSFVRAVNFTEKIKSEINKLKEFPNLGIEVENSCRKLMVGRNYKIIYEIDDDKINTLSIVNVRQNK